MTNKQIIIDGVDVAECEYAEPSYTTPKCAINDWIHCDGHDCHFKQLKRKEQECEELKNVIDIINCTNIEHSLEVKKYEKAIDEIKEIADNNYENPEMERIFNIIGGLDV